MKTWTGLAIVAATALGTIRVFSGTTSATAAPKPQAPASVLRSGTFVAAEHPTAGTARIVAAGNQRFVELNPDFRTDAGPDLQVILHKAPDVLATTKPPAYPIREGDYVNLGPLQKTTGAQRYPVPANVRIEQYPSVAVWCRRFNATFGTASLQKP